MGCYRHPLDSYPCGPPGSKPDFQSDGGRIAAALKSSPVATHAGDLSVACSIGVAQFNPAGGSLGELLDTTDQYWYQAKDAGRNCVMGKPPVSAKED